MRLSLLSVLASFAALIAGSRLGSEESVQIGEHTYQYLRAEPRCNTTYAGTVLLVHGFPDLAQGWHHQIPLLTSLGYRVIAPNMLGYPPTSAPTDIEPYTFNNLGKEISTLVKGFLADGEKAVIAGHDWGAAVVWRTIKLEPELYHAVINLATPNNRPAAQYYDLKDQIAATNGTLDFLKYQLQFREPGFEKRLQGKDKWRQFIRAAFDGKTPDGRAAMTNTKGIDFDLLDQVQSGPLLPRKFEDLYVKNMMAKSDLATGAFNYYRTDKRNWEDAVALAKEKGEDGFRVNQPVLFICGQRDPFVPCATSKNTTDFANIERHEVNSGHWIQLEAADEVNELIKNFLNKHKQ